MYGLLLLGLPACDVFKTEDPEDALGRGSKAFDPYAASASGAIRLGLQMFNGCAILAHGQPVAKGNSPIPGYPAQCDSPAALDPTHEPKVTPTARFYLMTDTNYFLNQLTLIDSVVNVHTNPKDLGAVTRWMRRESRFKSLDWSNLGTQDVRWGSTQSPGAWDRELNFNNANWMLEKNDTFKVEVLDQDGVVRQTTEYSRQDFLGESGMAGHTQVSYNLETLLPPTSVDDEDFRPAPSPVPFIHSQITYRTLVRMEVAGSTNPFKSFRVQGLSGDGAIRVTWSQMPSEPFYFPVTFIRPQDVAPTCFKDDDSPTPCGFGLDPRVKLSRPSNGTFYTPGETFDMFLDIRDSDGNRLHRSDKLPGYAEFYSGATNGLLYSYAAHFATLRERDITSAYQIVGPIQDMKTWSSVASPRPFYSSGGNLHTGVIPELTSLPIFAGLLTAQWPTRATFTLPPDAKPGTYAVVLRANRQFMGERMSKGNVFFFQVGQAEPTTYPNQVGNCQICHRGVVSLDNLRHGFSVDHIESCKACHMGTIDYPGRFQEEMHRLHMQSGKYKQDKSDCRVCHLSRQSAVRPSLATCKSCHPSAHGNDFYLQNFVNSGSPSRFSNCAQACHVDKTPSNHILPE